jgi:large subunit ribosomal protein L14
MIQKGTFLKVCDNSGAKIAYCIHNISKPTSKYAFIGDIVLVSIKQLNVRRRFAAKIKKGALAYALIVRSKVIKKFFYGDMIKFYETAAILFFRKTYKLIGTRVIGFVPILFRHSQFLRILSISAGVAH